jgi:hypothetical protein
MIRAKWNLQTTKGKNPMTISSGATGKRGELHVFGELLKQGIIPYAPIVDLEGIDCIIRKSDGSYVELQVKTLNTPKTPMWWQVVNPLQQENYFYALVSVPLGWATWILPSEVFIANASGPTGPKRNIYDLNLGSAGLETKLKPYKENWSRLA